MKLLTVTHITDGVDSKICTTPAAAVDHVLRIILPQYEDEGWEDQQETILKQVPADEVNENPCIWAVNVFKKAMDVFGNMHDEVYIFSEEINVTE